MAKLHQWFLAAVSLLAASSLSAMVWCRSEMRVRRGADGADAANEPTDSSFLAKSDALWRDYAQMQRFVAKSMRETGTPPPGYRALVYVAREGQWKGRLSGGIADRTTGMVSLFAVALAYNTAFFIDFPGLSEAYAPGEGNLDLWYDIGSHVDESSELPNLIDFPFQKEETKALFDSVSTQPVTFARAGKGSLHRFLLAGKRSKFRKIKRELAARDLTLSNAFETLFRYLFSPTKSLIDSLPPGLVTELTDPETTSILIQVRTGDTNIRFEESKSEGASKPFSPFPPHRAFFECAHQIETSLRVSPEQKIAWYLMTDSKHLKKWALAKFGDKIKTTSATAHLYHRKYKKSGLLGVLGDQYLASLCDHFVTSIRSGLGLQAAFRGKRVAGRIHVLDNFKDTAEFDADRDGIESGRTSNVFHGITFEEKDRVTLCWPPTPIDVAAEYWSSI